MEVRGFLLAMFFLGINIYNDQAYRDRLLKLLYSLPAHLLVQLKQHQDGSDVDERLPHPTLSLIHI